jgi:Tfp pilus assembly protein PilF
LADHIEALDAELAATAPAPAPSGAKARSEPAGEKAVAEDARRAAARNAFAVKQLALPTKRPLWLLIGTLSIAAAGIGGYVWFQIQALGNRSTLAPAGQPAAARPAPSPTSPAPAVTLPPRNPAPAAILPDFPRSTTTSRAETAARPPTPEPARRTAGAAGETAPSGIRFSRTRAEADPALQSGWSKLQASQFDAARRDYDKALQHDPNNVDALLGLAAIARREGRPADAERLERRAAEADPANPTAQAAQAGASSDPLAAETRLRTLLANQPESGPLNFALGNILSRQQRWPEAQVHYFNAVAAEPDNPDYLFNLAVSLDHLRQPKVAAQHYRLALEAARSRPAAFDSARVAARMQQLIPSSP